MTKVSIIGGGLSGLSAAILLANEGFEVSVYEKNNDVGGSFKSVTTANHQFEFGPSFFTLPEVLESVFRVVDKEIEDYIKIEKLTAHTKVYFNDGTIFYLTSDREKMIEQLEKVDTFAAARYDDFINEIRRVFLETTSISSEFQLSNWSKILGSPIRNLLLKLKPFESLDHFLRKYFQNENIIQLFSRYANQSVVQSKSMPAFMCAFLYPLLAHEVYNVKGGNMLIPKGLKKLAVELGVKFYTGKEVTKIHVKNHEIEGIQLNHHLSLESDYVVLSSVNLLNNNGILSEEFLQRERNKWVFNKKEKLSQFILFLGLDRVSMLEHHTMLFSNNVEQEIEQISNGEFPDNPSVYIFNPAYSDPERYPRGDSLVIIATVPFIDENSTSKRADIATYRYAILDKLKQHGFDIEKAIKEEKIWTPIDMRNMMSSFNGEIHGIVASSFSEAYIRPPVKSDDIEGLYFTFVNTGHPLGSTDALKNGMHLATTLIVDRGKIDE